MTRVSLLLIPCLIVLGCKAPVATGPRTPIKAASARPAATPTPSGLSSGPTTAVSGMLQMDAAYVVSAGGANVVSAGGANVVSAGGGNVISAGGANVISAGGGNVISAGGANVVSSGGANWIVRGFGLLAEQVSTVPLGTVLPAVGMLVVPVSLVTNRQIGEAVLSGAGGRYTVKVPSAQTGTFRLLAAVPGRSADDPVLKDPKLRYNFMTATSRKAEDNVVNEDTALAFDYLRLALQGRMQDGFAKGAIDVANTSSSALVQQIAKDVNDAMVEARTADLKPAQQQELARRCVGILFEQGMEQVYYNAAFKVTVSEDIPAPEAKFAGKPGDKVAMTVLASVLGDIRAQATEAMRRGVDLNEKPFVKAAVGAATPGQPLHGFRIQRPADLNEFVVHAYLSQNGVTGLIRMYELTRDDDLAFADPDMPIIRLKGAAEGVTDSLMLRLFVDPTTKKDVVQAIRDSRKP